MSTTAEAAPPRLEVLAITLLARGDNPRRNLGNIDGLVTSIQRQGVLQPILVGPPIGDKGGGYPVIAGNRRVAAAAEAGLVEIPAYVVDLQGQELIASLTENVQRESMTPVEEAEAIERLRHAPYNMKQADAIQALGKSERWGRERLRLLKLPDDVRDAMNERLIPLEATIHLERVAKGSTRAAQAIVEKVRKKPELARDLVDGDVVVAQVADIATVAGLQPCTDSQYYDPGTTFERLPIPDEARKRLTPAFDEIPLDPLSGRKATFKFDEDDANAAKAYGCLLELESNRHGVKTMQRYITDAEWLADRVEQKIPKMRKEIEKRVKERQAKGGKSAADPAKIKKEKAARERKEKKAQAINEELADRLNNMGTVKLDLTAAKLLAILALGEECDYAASEGLGQFDERYRFADGEGEEDRPMPGEVIWQEIAEAKTPAAVYKVLLRVVLAQGLSLKMMSFESKARLSLNQILGPHEGPLNIKLLVLDAAEAAGVIPQALEADVAAERKKITDAAEAAEKAKAAAEKEGD